MPFARQIDTNKDQQISREEVSEYLKKQLPQGHEGAGLDGMPDQDKLVEEVTRGVASGRFINLTSDV